MTWNIRNGGGDRLGSIAALIRRIQPDVLALQELRGFPAASFAASIGMDWHVARPVFGQAVGVFVRPPLTITGRSSVRWRLHHAAAVVTLSGGLTVVSTHLNPYDPSRRRREAVWLAARYAGRGPVVLAGDLNSLSSPGPVPAAYRRRHLAADGSVDTRAMAAFAQGGLADAWLSAGEGDGHTVPTGLGGAEFGPMRLDYVLLGGGLRASSARVVRDDPRASDHFPLVFSID